MRKKNGWGFTQMLVMLAILFIAGCVAVYYISLLYKGLL